MKETIKENVRAISNMLGNLETYTIPFVHDSSPIFIPKKHTVMSYAKQNRIAKKQRKNKNH